MLTTRKFPASFDALSLTSDRGFRPAWSLDGRVIAVSGALRSPTNQQQIVFVDSTSGAEQALAVQGSVFGLDWLDDGSLLLDQAVESGGLAQLWRLAYPSGAVTRLTNDLGSYRDVSVTATRDSFVTTKTDRRVAIWVSDGSGANAKEIVPSTQSSGGFDFVTWAGDRLLFTSTMAATDRSRASARMADHLRRSSLKGLFRARPPTAGRLSSDRPTLRARGSGRSLTGADRRRCCASHQAGRA